MGSFSIWHMLILLAVVLLLFGKGKISEIMGDVANGIKSFKKGMSDEETAKPAAEPPKVIEAGASAKTVEQPGVQSKTG